MIGAYARALSRTGISTSVSRGSAARRRAKNPAASAEMADGMAENHYWAKSRCGCGDRYVRECERGRSSIARNRVDAAPLFMSPTNQPRHPRALGSRGLLRIYEEPLGGSVAIYRGCLLSRYICALLAPCRIPEAGVSHPMCPSDVGARFAPESIITRVLYCLTLTQLLSNNASERSRVLCPLEHRSNYSTLLLFFGGRPARHNSSLVECPKRTPEETANSNRRMRSRAPHSAYVLFGVRPFLQIRRKRARPAARVHG